MQQQQHQQQPVPHPPHSMAMPQLTIPYCGPQPLYNTTPPCSIHSQPPGLAYGYHHHNNYPNFLPTSPSQPHAHPPPPLGTIPHSKSLDHYQDPAAAAMYNLTACMQRHSIDQPPFDYAAVSSANHYGGPMGMAPPSSGVYDAVDGCSMTTPYSNHPYNVSGNRFPLPYNLSANLGAPCMNGGMPGKQNGTESFYQPSINGYQQQQQQQHVMPPYYHHRSNSNGQLYGQQQQSHRHTAAEIYMNHNFDSTGPPLPPSILSKKKSSYDDYDVPAPVRHPVDPKSHAGDLIYIDTREEAKKERKKSDRSIRNADLLADYEIDMLPESLMERQHQQQQHHHHHQNQLRHPYLQHQTSRNSRQSDFDSYEDEQLQAGAYQRASNVSKRISTKNQEGIGSYESWNYVFQNLEKQGYSKDLGERGDVLVNPEDEEYPEANNSRGGTLKRSSNEKLKAMKPKAADKVDGIRMPSARNNQHQGATKPERDNERNENAAARAGQKNSLVQKLSKSSSNNPDNSHHQSRANHTSNPTSSRRNSITRKVSTSTKENGNSSSASGGGILVNHSNASASTTGKKKTASFDTAAATIINPHDASEWNCEFCTFLNPESRRICEMCAKSRDFNGTTTAATATSTSNGTATCV